MWCLEKPTEFGELERPGGNLGFATYWSHGMDMFSPTLPLPLSAKKGVNCIHVHAVWGFEFTCITSLAQVLNEGSHQLAVTHVRVTLADCGETRLLSQAHGWSQGNSVFKEGDHSLSTETPQLFLDCTQGVAGKVGQCGKKTRVTDLEETPVPTATQTSLSHWKVPAFVHSEIWFYFSS